jgi:hypothetical protein
LPAAARRARAHLEGRVYELEPDGLQFAKDITVSRRYAAGAPGSSIPAALLLTQNARGRWELLRRLSIVRNGRSLIVSGKTRHFSPIVTLDSDTQVRLNPERVVAARGQEWNATRTVTAPRTYDVNAEDWFATGAVERVAVHDVGRGARLRCKSIGTGTFGVNVTRHLNRDHLLTTFFLLQLGVRHATLQATATARCLPAGRVPPPPPPPPPPPSPSPTPFPTTTPTPVPTETPTPTPAPESCSTALRVEFTAYDFEGDTSGEVPATQVTGQCTGFGATRVHAPSGSQFMGYGAHSTGCSAPTPPWVYVECTTKPDGRICIILKVSPQPAPGTKFRVQLKRSDGTVVVDQELEATAIVPHCSTTG